MGSSAPPGQGVRRLVGIWVCSGKKSDSKPRSSAALAEALAPVHGRYDVVVLDAAPGVDAVAVNVLGCATEIVAPVALNPAALAGVLDFVRHVERVGRHNSKLVLKYLLPTFHDLRLRQSVEMLNQLREHFGPRVCPSIRVNVELAEAFGWHQSIFEYAPKSRGAADYTAFIDLVAEGDRAAAVGNREADLVCV